MLSLPWPQEQYELKMTEQKMLNICIKIRPNWGRGRSATRIYEEKKDGTGKEGIFGMDGQQQQREPEVF